LESQRIGLKDRVIKAGLEKQDSGITEKPD
jgi:hypothetical protein